ncbi:hypothetical protein WJX72_006199 [[Myrmecia] bisecta]|uniref:RRM domain-containing protein n=1 Tax=[Myrmecia] bisecta TaxID=41462 RepID=A0AAW1R7H7_9CHLO
MLQEIFSTLGPLAEVKVIKDRATNLNAGYGFVKYLDQRCAELALQNINGRVLYGQEVRVNWAFAKDHKEDSSANHHIFVGDLSSEVNDRMLLEAFSGQAGCADARVMWDHNTGRSKGYGFVSFHEAQDAERAIQAMHGQYIGHRKIRCGRAQHKPDTSGTLEYAAVHRADPTNANVYVGNLAPEVTDQELRRQFAPLGHVMEVKTYRKGNYGFVQFQRHEDAVRAIIGMNGQLLGGKALKCSWGRQQPRAASAAAANLALNLAQINLGLYGAGAGLPSMLPPQLQQPLPPPPQLAAQQQMLLQRHLAGGGGPGPSHLPQLGMAGMSGGGPMDQGAGALAAQMAGLSMDSGPLYYSGPPTAPYFGQQQQQQQQAEAQMRLGPSGFPHPGY